MSPRVGVTKVVVIDKGSGYIICLSIEHGLGNEGMYCVTEGADAKAGDTDKGSRHNLFLNMFVYRTWILETEYMHCVTQGGRYVNSRHRQGQWTYSFNMFVYRTWSWKQGYALCHPGC